MIKNKIQKLKNAARAASKGIRKGIGKLDKLADDLRDFEKKVGKRLPQKKKKSNNPFDIDLNF